MGFLSEIAADTFPDAHIVRGKEPELAIAKGLSWYGRASIRSEAFRKDVQSFLASTTLPELVTKALPGLWKRLAPRLAGGILQGVVFPAFQEWRGGRLVTLLDLEDAIRARAQEWMRSSTALHIIKLAVAEWFDDLRPLVNELTDPICDRHRIPKSSLDVPADTHFVTKLPVLDGLEDYALGDVGTLLTVVGAAVTAAILGGAEMALLMEGPIGWIIGFALGALVFFIGKEAALGWAKDKNIPKIIRWGVTEGSILKKLDEAKGEFARKLQGSLAQGENETAPAERLSTRVAAEIGAGIQQRADDTILRIG
jgi:hypothetical protein